MTSRRARGRRAFAGACRVAMALLLAAALGAQALPLSPAGWGTSLPAGEPGCAIEPVEVCGAGGPAAALFGELPLLPPAVTEIASSPGACPVPAAGRVTLQVGFAPAVYRPPRGLA